MSACGLYLGQVTHRRLLPTPHFLRYRVFQLYIDLDEAPSLSLRWFGFNRRALLSFYEADHGDGSATPLKTQIAGKLQAAGLKGGGAVRVLSIPRVLGWTFNPITLYFCHTPDGALSAVVHEVNNTVGGRCFYVLPAKDGGRIEQTAEKSMYVSPFMDMDYAYDFSLSKPEEQVSIGIRMRRGEELWLVASFAGARREFCDRELLRAWLSHPLVTLKVVAGIHWEALRIWLKGVKYRPPPSEPAARFGARG